MCVLFSYATQYDLFTPLYSCVFDQTVWRDFYELLRLFSFSVTGSCSAIFFSVDRSFD